MHLQLLVLQKTEGTVVIKPATFPPSLGDFIDVPDSDTRKIQQSIVRLLPEYVTNINQFNAYSITVDHITS